MAIPNKPDNLSNVIGYNADVYSIPDTTETGTGTLSYQSGWPSITSTALSAGGIPPQREYFNAVNKLLSQHVFFQQSGSLYDWSDSLSYNKGAHVLGSDGKEYVCQADNGPDTSAGTHDPTSDDGTYWTTLSGNLVQDGGGLGVDSDGKLWVDFDSMPTDRFEQLLKSIRVPVWLTRNKAFYVNGTTGSDDTKIEGIGESQDKPFKTIQACVTYVTDNYNISSYTCTIYIAPGTYEETVTLPNYNRTTGSIVLTSLENGNPPIITYTGVGRTIRLSEGAGPWYLRNLHLRFYGSPREGTTSRQFCSILQLNRNSLAYLQRCQLTCELLNVESPSHTITLRMIEIASEATLSMPYVINEEYLENRWTFTNNAQNNSYINTLYCSGSFTMTSSSTQNDKAQNIYCSGKCTYFIVVSGGSFMLNTAYTNRMKFVDEGVTGTRYYARYGGAIHTGNAGADYFPGNQAGTVEESTYSWYN